MLGRQRRGCSGRRLRRIRRRMRQAGRGNGNRIMLGAKTQADQSKRIDLAIGLEFLAGLEALHGVNGIVSPFAIHLSLEITAAGERLLDLLVAFGIRMKLVRRSGGAFGAGTPASGFMRFRSTRR